MSGRWRLFVAVELPEDARSAIVRAVDGLRPIDGLRAAPPDQLHLTILFLGAVESGLRSDVGERVAAAAAEVEPFRTALTSFGTFPQTGRARVLWVGLRDDDGALARVAASTKEALRDLVITEDRPFRAHVTVARARRPITVPGSVRDAAVEPVLFDVDALTLFRSHLGGGASPRYEALGRWHLGASTP